MTRRPSSGLRRRPSALALLALVGALIGAVVPLLYLLSVSFMDQGQVAAGLLVPSAPAVVNYPDALASGTLIPGIVNSLVAAVELTSALSTCGKTTFATSRNSARMK